MEIFTSIQKDIDCMVQECPLCHLHANFNPPPRGDQQTYINFRITLRFSRLLLPIFLVLVTKTFLWPVMPEFVFIYFFGGEAGNV